MIQFIKTRQVKDPIRVPSENAGIDFYIPDNTPEFRRDFFAKNPNVVDCEADEEVRSFFKMTGEIWIAPHDDIIIPSGIKSKFDSNLALIANNKSGIATKKKLIFGASVIDCSYQGEWHFHLINTSKRWQKVECGQKVIQFIPHLISTDDIEILDVPEAEFFTEKTARGDGWQGSTGLN